MSELLRLKVSPKGQITLPKRVRASLSIKDYVYLEIKGNKAVLKPVSFVDEFEDMVVRELKYDGYSAEQIEEILPEKKKKLSQAILEELKGQGEEIAVQSSRKKNTEAKFESALSSESALEKDWLLPEEEEAWSHL